VDVSLRKIGFRLAPNAHTETLQGAVKVPSLTCLWVWEPVDVFLGDLDSGHF
jgi:hypothetical protein